MIFQNTGIDIYGLDQGDLANSDDIAGRQQRN